jgi:HlyD family secretion protein
MTAKAASDAPHVGTMATRLGDVSQTVTVTGALAALNDVPLSIKQAGRLSAVYFHNGDYVKAGQVVARIDPTDLISAVREDEATVAANRAGVADAEAAYRKQLTSTQTGIVSAQAAYAQQVATSSSSVRSAQSALAGAQANLSEILEGDRPEDRAKTNASLVSAQANYKKAQADYSRYQQLHNAGAISDADMDQYKNALDTADASLKSAEASVAAQVNGNRRQDIAQAQEKVRQARETLRQQVAARSTDAVKKADLETARAGVADNAVKLAAVQSAQATLQQSLAALAVAQQAVRDSAVVSPVSGYVSGRAAEPGQMVTSSATLLHVISLVDIYYEPSVPNDQITAIHVGQPISVTIDALPGKTFTGTVSRIYPESSSTTRSVSIRVSLPNEGGFLRPGMYARGLVATAVHKNVVLAPVGAIATDSSSGQSYVYVVENDVAHKRAVTPGIASADGSVIEVGGIPSGAQVIVDGLNGMADGQKVTAAPASAGVVQ